jgi:DNA polymerase III delta prime subunit
VQRNGSKRGLNLFILVQTLRCTPGYVQVIELPIKHPELFEALGVAQPKGVLLYGPPGTGKTLLARAVAHHTDCTFIRVSGSELVQKYIGEGSRMVRRAWIHVHALSLVNFLAGHSATCRSTITTAAGALYQVVMQLGFSASNLGSLLSFLNINHNPDTIHTLINQLGQVRPRCQRHCHSLACVYACNSSLAMRWSCSSP